MSEKKSVYSGKIATLQTMIEPGDDAPFIFEQLLKLELEGTIEDRYVEAMMLERGLSYDLLANEGHMEVMRRMFLVRMAPEEVKVLATKKEEILKRQRESRPAPKVVTTKHNYVEWLATKKATEVAVVAGKREDSVAGVQGYDTREVVWFEMEGVLGIDFVTSMERDRFVSNTRDVVVVIDRYAEQAADDVRGNVIADWDQVCSVDCEMVGCDGWNRLSAIVAVDKDGKEIYQAVVKPRDRVDDYREHWSTITRAQVQAGRDEWEVVAEVRALLKDKIVVMHDCRGDLSVLPGLELRGVVDTYTITRKSLKKAYKAVTGKEMAVAHDPGEDAKAAMIIARATAKCYDKRRWLDFNDSSMAQRQERERAQRARQMARNQEQATKNARKRALDVRRDQKGGTRVRYRLELVFASGMRDAVHRVLDAPAKKKQLVYEARMDNPHKTVLTIAARAQVRAWQLALRGMCVRSVVTTFREK